MIKKALKIILFGFLGTVAFVIVCYAGITAYANFVTFRDTGLPNTPSISRATDSFRIMNTGNTLMTSKYEQIGEVEGQRVFILHGYWELVKNDYKYRKGDARLDEKVFGLIRHTRRS